VAEKDSREKPNYVIIDLGKLDSPDDLRLDQWLLDHHDLIVDSSDLSAEIEGTSAPSPRGPGRAIKFERSPLAVVTHLFEGGDAAAQQPEATDHFLATLKKAISGSPKLYVTEKVDGSGDDESELRRSEAETDSTERLLRKVNDAITESNELGKRTKSRIDALVAADPSSA
jgi:hypothetical protein